MRQLHAAPLLLLLVSASSAFGAEPTRADRLKSRSYTIDQAKLRARWRNHGKVQQMMYGLHQSHTGQELQELMRVSGMALNQGLVVKRGRMGQPDLVLTRRFGSQGLRLAHTEDRWADAGGTLFRRVSFGRPWMSTLQTMWLSPNRVDRELDKLADRVLAGKHEIVTQSSWGGRAFDRQF